MNTQVEFENMRRVYDGQSALFKEEVNFFRKERDKWYERALFWEEEFLKLKQENNTLEEKLRYKKR